jgi:hypothetical protein
MKFYAHYDGTGKIHAIVTATFESTDKDGPIKPLAGLQSMEILALTTLPGVNVHAAFRQFGERHKIDLSQPAHPRLKPI